MFNLSLANYRSLAVYNEQKLETFLSAGDKIVSSLGHITSYSTCVTVNKGLIGFLKPEELFG